MRRSRMLSTRLAATLAIFLNLTRWNFGRFLKRNLEIFSPNPSLHGSVRIYQSFYSMKGLVLKRDRESLWSMWTLLIIVVHWSKGFIVTNFLFVFWFRVQFIILILKFYRLNKLSLINIVVLLLFCILYFHKRPNPWFWSATLYRRDLRCSREKHVFRFYA